MRTGLGAGAFALSALTVSAAWAAGSIGPAITAQGYYQQSSGLTSNDPPTPGDCMAAQTCYVVFDRVPAGHQLIVTQVSCLFVTSGGTTPRISTAILTVQRPNGTEPLRRQHLTPINEQQSLPTSTVAAVSVTTLQLFDARERPMVWMTSDTVTHLAGSCTIAGQLKPQE
jgi:hypothetical protein